MPGDLDHILREQRLARDAYLATGDRGAALGVADWVMEELLVAEKLQAPFPWFGGKSRVADIVWDRFGNVPNYVEPFFGSGAVLLARPHDPGIETINDKDGFVANFWRAVRADPEHTASYADWPSNENDLHARHSWLKDRRGELSARLEGDPEYFDPKIAGWWVWGMAQWIGGGFCGDSGGGPWVVVDGKLVRSEDGDGVARRRVHLGNSGQGVARKLVHLGNSGQGVARKLVHLGNSGQGLYEWFEALATRLRFVRVCCGDWSRIMGPSPTTKLGITGVFLDPPYSEEAGRDGNLYAEEDLSVAHTVREWALAHGDDPLMRIALCGYEGEHAMPENWECYAWSTSGGYARLGKGDGTENRKRERIWFSPNCLKHPTLF
jgi:site-specific DNA-adenine methylase